MSTDVSTEYRYSAAGSAHTHAYLMPVVYAVLENNVPTAGGGRRVFDLGCGNGAGSEAIRKRGYQVTGVDPSESGIHFGRQAYPHLNLDVGSAYHDLRAKYGRFPAVVSLEVIEHVYAPRHYAKTLFDLLEPGGIAVLSTPYHGYFKNLALALSGRMDAHFTALWDHGHIKFWSITTLTTLLNEVGLHVEEVHRVGRIPALAKSMIFVARKRSP